MQFVSDEREWNCTREYLMFVIPGAQFPGPQFPAALELHTRTHGLV